MRKRTRQDNNLAKDKQNGHIELPDVDSEINVTSRPYISQDTHTSGIQNKRSLDINWVEEIYLYID